MVDRNALGFHGQKNMGSPFHLGFERLLDTPMAVFTYAGSATEWPYADALHKVQPDCLILGRELTLESFVSSMRTNNVPSEEAAEKYFQLFDIPGRPKYIYWTIVDHNGEWGGGEGQNWKWLTKFDLAFAKLANAKGYKVGLGNMSEGNPPEPPYNPNFADMWTSDEYYKPILEYIDSVGQDFAVLQRHNYMIKCADENEIDAHLMRFKLLYDHTEKEGLKNVTFAFGEIGSDVPGWMKCPRPSTEPDDTTWRFNVMKRINSMISAYPRVWGGAWYTFDSSGDGIGDYRIPEAVFNMWQSYAKTLKISIPTASSQIPIPTPIPNPKPIESILIFKSIFDVFEPRKFADDRGDQMIPPGFDTVWSKSGKGLSIIHGELSPSREASSKPNSYILWGMGRFNGAIVKKQQVEKGSKYRISIRSSVVGESEINRQLMIDLTGGDDPLAEHVKSIEAIGNMESTTQYDIVAIGNLITVFWKVFANITDRVESKLFEVRIDKLPDTSPTIPETHGVNVKTLANLNLRCGPGTEFDILKVMPKDSNLKVYGPGNNSQLRELIGKPGWLVVMYDGIVGYCASSYLELT